MKKTINVNTPILSQENEKAALHKWKKNVGDTIFQGEVLNEIETDKVILDVFSPEDGILSEILIGDGGSVKSGQLIALIETKIPAATNEVSWNSFNKPKRNLNGPLDTTLKIESLEKKIYQLTRRLDSFEKNAGFLSQESPTAQSSHPQEVLAWLASQEQVAREDLSNLLLPLHLLPAAFIEDINEKSIGLTGDLALVELNELIIITKANLDKVIANQC